MKCVTALISVVARNAKIAAWLSLPVVTYWAKYINAVIVCDSHVTCYEKLYHCSYNYLPSQCHFLPSQNRRFTNVITCSAPNHHIPPKNFFQDITLQTSTSLSHKRSAIKTVKLQVTPFSLHSGSYRSFYFVAFFCCCCCS